MLTVVYIEDNAAKVRLVERIMALRPDVRLLVADRGRAGLRLVAAERPDLILLDGNLPDMSGKQVLAELASDVT